MKATLGWFAAGALVLLSGLARAEEVAPEVSVDIAAQPMADALNDWAQQTGYQLIFPEQGATAALVAPAVVGKLTPQAALRRLLAGSGLEFDLIDSRTVAIRRSLVTGAETAAAGNVSTGQPLVLGQVDSPAPSSSSTGITAIGVLNGRVSTPASGSAAAGALVRVLETGQVASSDELGRFRFTLPPGEYTLSISYIGFAEKLWRVTVGADDSQRPEFVMEASAWDQAEVTVFGTRTARAKALNLQRTADNSSSVISADLLGNFPDETISEALRRAPGVSFERGMLGEGRNVVIRGLESNYNNLRLNGLNLPSTVGGSSRAPELNALLADSVEKITVNETLLPSMDSAGTGGLIEIETKSPLDRPARFASVSFERGGKAEDFGDDVSVSGTVSGTFGSEQNFGLSASVQYLERSGRTYNYESNLTYGQYLPLDPFGAPTLNGVGFFDPRRSFPFEDGAADAYASDLRTTVSDVELINRAYTVSAEWSVSAATRLQLDVQRSQHTQSSFSRGADFSFEHSYQLLPVAALGGEERQALAWDETGSASQSYTIVPGQKSVTDTYSFRGASELGRWEHSWTLGHARGSSSSRGSTQLSFDQGFDPLSLDRSALAPGAVDPVEGRVISVFGRRSGRGFRLPSLSDAGWQIFNDTGIYGFSNGGVGNGDSDNDRYTAELSSKWNLGFRYLTDVQIGADYETTRFTSNSTSASFVGVDFSQPSMASLGLTFTPYDLNAIGVSGSQYRLLSRGLLESFAAGMDALAQGDGRLLDKYESAPDPRLRREHLTEKNLASYVQARTDIGKLSMIGGFRFSHVDVESVRLTSPQVIQNFVSDEAFRQRFTSLETTSAAVTNVLPRLQLNYRQTDKLIFRGGYFLTVARPAVLQLSSQKEILLNLGPFGGGGPTFQDPLLQIIEGNPGLKPALADNYDLSVEYYADQIGLVKLSAFYKTIEHLIQYNSSQLTGSLEGVALPDDPYFENLPANLDVRVIRPVNSPDEAEHWGISLALERQLTFLPGLWSGLGFYGNYTYSIDKTPQLFTWFSKPLFDDAGNFAGTEQEVLDVGRRNEKVHSGTVSLTYNLSRFDGSLSFSWQGTEPGGFTPYGLRELDESAAALDLRLQYQLNAWHRKCRIYLEGSDLLRGPSDPDDLSEVRAGGGAEYVSGGTFFGGRALRLGVAASF